MNAAPPPLASLEDQPKKVWPQTQLVATEDESSINSFSLFLFCRSQVVGLWTARFWAHLYRTPKRRFVLMILIKTKFFQNMNSWIFYRWLQLLHLAQRMMEPLTGLAIIWSPFLFPKSSNIRIICKMKCSDYKQSQPVVTSHIQGTVDRVADLVSRAVNVK